MSRTFATLSLLAAGSLLVLPAGCGRSEDLGPPQIAYGQTECNLCRMIISEEPFAAAAVIASSDGVQKLAFDDIGCLLDFLAEQPPGKRIVSYVHDYASREWVDASAARFVRSDSLQTPMASHLAACKTAAGAADLLKRYPGNTTTLDQLRTAAGPSLASDSSATERSAP